MRILLALALISAGLFPAKSKYITYEKYGAVGDGVHDDMPAIVAAHEAANEKGLPVKVKSGKCYYIGGGNLVATPMQTACCPSKRRAQSL